MMKELKFMEYKHHFLIQNPSLLLYICSMYLKKVIFFFFCSSTAIYSQYTDQINSNRPGASVGAFSVGKNVIQSELGFSFRRFTHNGYNNSTFNGGIGFLSLRWGFISEKLELLIDSKYLMLDDHYNLVVNGETLSKFTKDEQSTLAGYLTTYIDHFHMILNDGLVVAMNTINQSKSTLHEYND